MTVYIIELILAVAGAAATVILAEIHAAWLLLIFPGWYLGVCLIHIIFAFAVSVLPGTGKKPKVMGFHYLVLWNVIYTALRMLRVYFHIEGRDKLPPPGETFLIVANHPSHFDPMVMHMALPKYPLVSISKPENFRMPVVGSLSRRAGFIAIDRSNPREAIRAIRRASELMKSGTSSVAVYPEGTISRDKGLAGFHEGVFLAAKKAGVPIVVMTIIGTDRIKKQWFYRPSYVYMKIEKVFTPKEVRELTNTELSALSRELIRATMLSHELKAPAAEEAVTVDLSKR